MAALEKSKYETFVQKWHELDNKTAAYKIAFPASLRWKEATVNNKASALSKVGEVLARYKELQEISGARHGVTIDSLMAELNEIKAVALSLETPQCSAAVSSVMSKAKLVGFDVVKIEHSGTIAVGKTLDDFYSEDANVPTKP